ncbi:MAG: Hsp20/alpha crystallin family protein [Alphaproteobacteria bacterium TMED194]|nr:MAG: Hsp20/alpha crystallin family protein [Alphaproteobacteria bacterium TMED194]|tara:strand:- start:7646 stop:8095 length:450 start_codon:yes stop_codon:yes gene_type:complete
MTGLNINQLHPFAVGFDRVFDRLVEFPHQHQAQGFPPYNIRRDADKFFIDLALAGLDINDVEIEVKEDVLTVRSTWDEAGDYFNGGGDYVHRGISFKKFTRSFTLADDIEVIGANFKNGLLTVALERIIPESKKARKIKIDTKKEFLKG